MSDTLSTFHKHRIHYSPMLQPSMKDGHKCIVIGLHLKESNPEFYESIIKFTRANNLRVCNEDVD